MLPHSRGPLTAVLFHELRQRPHRLPPIVLPDATAPLADDDLQLALYALYELHYRGFEGVDERWEWEPSLLAVRSVLEDIFEGGLYYAIGPPDSDVSIAPEDMDVALRGVADADDAPSLSPYLERDGTAEQFRAHVPSEGFLRVGQRTVNATTAVDNANAVAFPQQRRHSVAVGYVICELLVVVGQRRRD